MVIENGSIVAFTQYRYDGEQRLASRISKPRLGVVIEEMKDREFCADPVFRVQIIYPESVNYRRAIVWEKNLTLILQPIADHGFTGKNIPEIISDLAQTIKDLQKKK